MIVSPAKTAEPIEMPSGLWTRVDTKKHGIRWGSHWRHVANTTEPSMCCSDAAFCEIILTTCYTTDYTTELGSATANRAVRRIVKKVQMSSNLQVYAKSAWYKVCLDLWEKNT